jgi:hypothetical protein
MQHFKKIKPFIRMFAPLLYIGSTVVNLTGVLNNGYPDYPAFVICLLAFSLLLYNFIRMYWWLCLYLSRNIHIAYIMIY